MVCLFICNIWQVIIEEKTSLLNEKENNDNEKEKNFLW
jgi:hypothetical protein